MNNVCSGRIKLHTGEIMAFSIHGTVTKYCLQISIGLEIICTQETGCTLNQRLKEHKTCKIVVTRHIKSYWICDKYLCLSNFTVLQTAFPRGWLKNTRTPHLSVLKCSSSQDLWRGCNVPVLKSVQLIVLVLCWKYSFFIKAAISR